MSTFLKHSLLVVSIAWMLIVFPDGAFARGEFSLPFAKAETRNKTLLVLPVEATVQLALDGVQEDLRKEAERFKSQTVTPVLAGLKEKGFELSALEHDTVANDPELKGLIEEIYGQLDNELKKFSKERKGVRYNWYRVGPAAYKVSKRFGVDGLIIPRLAGVYSATTPSSGQLAGSVAKAGVMAALGGFSAISSNQVFQDFIEVRLVFIDGDTGYLDGVVYETSKLKPLLEKPAKETKVFTKVVKKMLKALPAESKTLKLQIVEELYDMKERRSFADGSEDQILQEIEQMLQE